MRSSIFLAVIVVLFHYSPVLAWGKKNAKCSNGQCATVQYSYDQPTVYYYPSPVVVRPSVPDCVNDRCITFPVPVEYSPRVTPAAYSILPESPASTGVFPVTNCSNGRCTTVYYYSR